jgi:3-hydroxybutyryl-CoA dehydrogenase
MHPKKIGITGLGLLGRGIAACLLAHGFEVVAYDLSESNYAHAQKDIETAFEELIEHANWPPESRNTWQPLYTEATSLQDLASCDFIIESITESLEAKIALFDELEAILPLTIPIASNTSALPITLLQQGRKHPDRFLGMHWSIPAYATRFLELIRGEATSEASLAIAIDLGYRLAKDPCIVERDIPGFIVNRIGYAMYREACNLLALGIADAETIDKAFRNSVGLWASVCGPLRWIDITGGPALYGRAMTGVLPTLSNATEVPEPLLSLMQAGATGTGNGQGFFTYTPEQTREWEQIYRKQVWRVRAIHEETFPLPTDNNPNEK